MTGFLLGLVFAAGVALLFIGTTTENPTRVRLLFRGGSPGLRALVLLSALLTGLAVWALVGVPILSLAAGLAGGYAPIVWANRRKERKRRDRERAWPATLSALADGLEAGLAFPAAVSHVAEVGPEPLRADLAAFHARLRSSGLGAALDGLREVGERTADTVVLLLRAALLDLPAGGLAPLLRDLAAVLNERFESVEKARSRASSLQLEAAILALSPAVLLVLIGLSSPAYLDAYRTPAGTLVGAIGGLLIFGCYLLMRHLGRIPEPRRTVSRR